MNIRAIARLLSGEVAGPGRILCPGPGHSPGDRSLSITFIGADEPIVHSFAGDDWRACKDHVARLLGLPAENGPRPPVARAAPHACRAQAGSRRRQAQRGRARHLAVRQAGTGNAGRDLSRLARHDLPPPDALRFHAGLKHPSGGIWPAMVALVTSGADGTPLAIHRTFLARDGGGKAPVDRRR